MTTLALAGVLGVAAAMPAACAPGAFAAATEAGTPAAARVGTLAAATEAGTSTPTAVAARANPSPAPNVPPVAPRLAPGEPLWPLVSIGFGAWAVLILVLVAHIVWRRHRDVVDERARGGRPSRGGPRPVR
ncbi:hypothetical protein [Frondihabitans australicus]|uniref:Uncharacterized protein n=1 Tax=Frondihabitans australicus TaxID=386892 RepID=A0A495IEN4_9MICO|nr:hypothetical protein [Frondihabitans australicus]RKR73466.1 hypothetical protein C8E83_0559 [Frondihabitans australicus]